MGIVVYVGVYRADKDVGNGLHVRHVVQVVHLLDLVSFIPRRQVLVPIILAVIAYVDRLT